MRYPQDFVDKVMDSANLVEIISQHTQLKQSGNGFMGRCPFPDHKEKTPSFSVSEAKQVYHCFGCKKSGNVFTFLRDFSGFSYVEAIEFLADRNNIKIPEPEQNEYAQQQNDKHHLENAKKKSLTQVNRVAADFFKTNLGRARENDLIAQYVKRRGLNAETIKEFEIGFADGEWEGLVQELNRKKISLDLAEEARLIRPRKEQNGFYDLFRERLMFPIHNLRGEVIAFGGRIYDQGEPKYLNSPESLVFNKSKILYGLFQSAKYVRSEDAIVIVEGYMDMVSLYQAGIKNCVATMGTALTEEHAKLIKRMTPNVYVLFDSDDAGQSAAERSLGILLSHGLYPKGIVLEKAKDPDEFIQKFGVDALTQVIKAAPDLFKIVLRQWMTDYSGESSQKVKLVDQLGPLLGQMADGRLAELYKQDVAQRLAVSIDWINSALRQGPKRSMTYSPSVGAGLAKLNNQNSSIGGGPAGNDNRPNKLGEFGTRPENGPQVEESKTQNEQIRQKIRLSQASKAEKMLVSLLLKSRANMGFFLKEFIVSENENLTEVEQQIPSQLFTKIIHSGARQILEKAEQVYRQDLEKFDKLFSLLIDRIDEPQVLFLNVEEEHEQKLIVDAFKKIQQEFLKHETKKFKMDLRQDSDLKNNLQGGLQQDLELNRRLKEFEDLQKNRLGIKKPSQ
jgi:DNA primase